MARMGRPPVIPDARSVTFDVAADDLDELLRLVDDEKGSLAALLRIIVRGYLDSHGIHPQPRRQRRRLPRRGSPAASAG